MRTAETKSATLKPAATDYLPGILLCLAVTIVAIVVEHIEASIFGRAWLEALVLAILLGTALRTAWSPPPRFARGITFCAKTVLEVAVLLLGASISLQAIEAAGLGLLFGIAAIVVVAILASYAIGRALGLPTRMAILVAAGNSICGNSAIAAVAPVIGASSKDVASSIAFTAVLGVVVVIALPLAVPLLHMTELQYGVLAGLTVYAVPQVLAATAPIGTLAVQTGTLVKLVRVLMLGPLVTILSIGAARQAARTPTPGTTPRRMTLNQIVPWFILGFLALAVLRSLGVIPTAALPPRSLALQRPDHHLHGRPRPRRRRPHRRPSRPRRHRHRNHLPSRPPTRQPPPDSPPPRLTNQPEAKSHNPNKENRKAIGSNPPTIAKVRDSKKR